MSAFSTLYETLSGLAGPWVFLGMVLSFLPGAVASLCRDRKFGTLFNPFRLQNAWFSRFWRWMAPRIRDNTGPTVLALLDGRFSGGRVVDERVNPGIGGTVIELGPGPGYWVDIFKNDPALLDDGAGKDNSVSSTADASTAADLTKPSPRTKITCIYGVEPNRDQHPSLQQKIKEAKLESVYHIVPVGIEDLQSHGGIEKGSVDCIVSILCLCSIPEPQHNIRELYSYLKKGGRWYIFEHVRADVNIGMRMYQAFVNLFWPHFVGGCTLCRPTHEWITEAGEWDKIDIMQPPDELWHQTVPHRMGVFVK
ncbi:methyltransferase domain-containing protein [Xylariales sp. PMI_506]|nr:methyltransferase domain-containing protein [Xylariales sp. PMI_506]